ncbi:alpha/beta hydrolase [Sphingomonas psychrotolerans]|nr:alpha/beta hydrolase [Sphingomonas psychrotolerans]
MATALTLPANLSLVEISAAATAPWRDLFAAPAQAHVPYRADTLSERNLLGARLDSAVTRAEGAVLLVAEGAGCFATAWWARLSPASYVSRVAGALFFDPIADEEENVESLMDTFASPRTRLPFPSIVLGRDDRRTALAARVQALADGWGSGMIAGSRSDVDGPLRRTRGIIARFTAGVVAREVRTGRALIGRVRPIR